MGKKKAGKKSSKKAALTEEELASLEKKQKRYRDLDEEVRLLPSTLTEWACVNLINKEEPADAKKPQHRLK
jgi:hypothetical protein